MDDVNLPGPHTRMVLFAETVFKLKFKLRYVYAAMQHLASVHKSTIMVVHNFFQICFTLAHTCFVILIIQWW